MTAWSMPIQSLGTVRGRVVRRSEAGASAESGFAGDFVRDFARYFRAHHDRLFRVLDRLSGDPDLAADLTQEAFIRLHGRGAMPDAPDAWIITVALNLYRNATVSVSRRRELLTLERGAALHSEPERADQGTEPEDDRRERVRAALDALPARDRELLLLRAEGYAYRDLAEALSLNEASVGVLLARAKERFRRTYEEVPDAT